MSASTVVYDDSEYEGAPSRSVDSRRLERLSSAIAGKEKRHRIEVQNHSQTHVSPTVAAPSPLLDGFPTFDKQRDLDLDKAAAKTQLQKKTLVQEWEGIVDRVTDEVFSGLMRPILGEKQSDEFTEQGEFDLTSLSSRDREKIRIGTRFRWAIGVSWQGSNPYDYQHLYVPEVGPISQVESDRIDADIDRFSKLFSSR